ncbi:MAG: primosomal protein N' [Actinobacteria bacterium RBG_16_64_13]|nr:MAG: primosomal protein N' [Actinobacteria bacterium RBG_16_64_13]
MVQLVPLLRLRHLGDRVFDYLVPPELTDRIHVGSVVWAPFGRRSARAVVVAMADSVSRELAELRAIESTTDDAIPQELLALARAVSERYLSSYESCLRLVAPPLAARRRLGGKPARNTWVTRVPASTAEATVAKLTTKQAAVLDAIPPGGSGIGALCACVDVGRGVLRALAAKGVVELGVAPEGSSMRPERPIAEALPCVSGAAMPRLWPEQEQAVEQLVAAYEQPGSAQRLLWGVTGSGKTEVYLRLVSRVLEDGAGAILLVPEIALTPQMIARVRARFGDKVGVLHSGLAPGERVREYRRIARGDAPVVVGARSAVFAPLANVKLIVVDESHDTSYKQEEEPRYHALTVAQLRLGPSGGLLLEGSATPRAESVGQPEECVRLTRRAAGAVPECEVVDMRTQGGGQLLAPRCREALAETLRRGEQAIVLLNRRGYAGYVHCDLCGHVMMCSDCELSVTYHSRVGRLLCHHCGRTYAQPALCPACAGAPLTRAAPGTERLDRELRTLVPHEQVFRMDSDTLTSGTRVQALLRAFESSRPAVLVGTQMVAKGHDFADVTLVLVADADTGLYVPDFRAAERTFQLLTQVAGRAGRAERPGRVLVQTWNPGVPCIRMALLREEKAFYEQELESRRRLGYPPFADLVRLMTVAENGERAQVGAQYLVERLSAHFSGQELHGPARLPTLRGRARWHLVIAAGDGERARAIVKQAMTQLQEPYRRRGVTLLVDVDPQSFS